MKLTATSCLLFIAMTSTCLQAGIISDLDDGSHLWTSTLVPGDPIPAVIVDSLLEMSDTFTANGTVSFDYEFRHFVTAPGQSHRPKSGAGNIDIGSSLDVVDYTFANNTSEHTESGSVSGLNVLIGEIFSFRANTLASVHSIGPTVTLEITNFEFVESSSEGSAVPEPSSLALLSMGAIALGLCGYRRRKAS